MTRVSLFPLTPGTSYQFRVSALTTQGSGEEIVTRNQTIAPQEDSARLAFIQVRIGPILSCIEFQGGETTERLNLFENGLVNELNRLCSCGLTVANLKDSVFSCANGLILQAVYRARILGTDNYSCRDLVSLIQSWITNGSASIYVGNFRFQLDPSCPSSLDSPFSPDCIGQHIVTTTSTKSTPTAINSSQASATGGEIGMIVAGLLIALLLIGLITLIVGLILKKWKSGGANRFNRRFDNAYENRNKSDEAFSNFSDSTRGSALFDSQSDLVKEPSTNL